jgi:GNAT superfamily N-acetyltransferase
MTITYQKTADLHASALITYQNMRSYYEHFSVDWQADEIKAQIVALDNWDIVDNGKTIGAIRLAFEDACCYLRDLQVIESAQNQGVGAFALKFCEKIARDKKLTNITLRVFKISPATHLYLRSGFIVDSEEERFYYMSKAL